MTRRTTILSIFFLQAFAAGGLFPRISDIQAGLGLDEATLGIALTAAAAGGLATNLAAGRLVQGLGTRVILGMGVPLLAATTAGVALAPSLPLLFAALLAVGTCFTLTNIAMNLEADRVESETGRRVMNRCHGFWSAGMLLAALTGTFARGVPLPATLHLTLVVPVVCAFLLPLAFRMRPAPPAPDDKLDGPRFAMPSRRTLGLMLFGISGGIAQSATQNWSVIYVEQTFATDGWIATLPLSAFLVAMTLGRMLADGWSERHGPLRTTYALACLALFGALCVVLAPSVWVAMAGFAFMGTGIAALFPLMISGAARSGNRPAAESVAAVLVLSGLVMLAVPALMGWIAESFGLRIAFWALVPPFLVTLALVRRTVAASLPSSTR